MEARIVQALDQKFVESGEQERLKELLRRRLEEFGWHDDIRKHLKEVIKRRGIEKVSVDDLIEEVTPKARQNIPDNVKRELMNQIESFINKQTNINLSDT